MHRLIVRKHETGLRIAEHPNSIGSDAGNTNAHGMKSWGILPVNEGIEVSLQAKIAPLHNV